MEIQGSALDNANLRNYYRLEADGTDTKGNATLTGVGPPSHVAGKYGNGTDIHTSWAHSQGYKTTINPLSGTNPANVSIGFWAKLSAEIASGGGRFFELLTADSAGVHGHLDYEYNAGTRRLRFYRNLTTTDATFYHNVTLGTTWHHFLWVLSGTTTVTGFLDGVQVGTNTGSGTAESIAATNRLVLGNARDLGAFGTPILTDDWGIWEAALGLSDAQALADVGASYTSRRMLLLGT